MKNGVVVKSTPEGRIHCSRCGLVVALEVRPTADFLKELRNRHIRLHSTNEVDKSGAGG